MSHKFVTASTNLLLQSIVGQCHGQSPKMSHIKVYGKKIMYLRLRETVKNTYQVLQEHPYS